MACLLAVAATFGALASPAAAAQPKAPGLLGTNPPSPSAEKRPSVKGNSDGVVASGLGRLRTAAFRPVAQGLHPNFLIAIYANDPCTSKAAIVGEGTAAELDGGGVPLSVDLEENAETTLYANETDPSSLSEPSQCSNGILYQQVGSPPQPPAFGGSIPASPADDNTPELFGTAATHSTVTFYTDPECTNGFAGSGTAAEFTANGIEVSVPDNSTTTFYATATLAGFTSACSTSSLTYQELTSEGPPPGEEEPPLGEEPPAGGGGGGGGGEEPREKVPDPPGKPAPPKLRTTPEGTANYNTPTVTGKAPGAARVEVFDGAGCRGDAVASGTAAQFASGLAIKVPDNSTESFYAVSIDGGGDRSGCSPEPVVYVEDSTPPHVELTSGPAARTRKRMVQFTFVDTSEDPSTTFLCRLDHRKWSPCGSPLRLRHLGPRRHKLMVSGIDAAGNVAPAGTKRSFRVTRGR